MNAGDVLADRFRLVRELGRGSLGVVWLATDAQLNDDYTALKILNPRFVNSRESVAELKREILLARRLRHPNILAVYTFWEADAYRFISMEYIDGPTLAELLRKRGKAFPVHEVLPWAGQLCQALDFAHAQGLLHRDVKPANVLLAKDDTVRLADFSIARTMDELKDVAATSAETRGTLSFMSPEQLGGTPIDHRSDQYSLACTLYQLLSGEAPFPPVLPGNALDRPEPKPVEGLGTGLNAALLRMLAPDPKRRYPSCSAFFVEFARAFDTAVAEGLMPDAPATRLTAAEEETVRLERGFRPHEPTVILTTHDPRLASRRFGQILVDASLITESQLETALAEQKASGDKLGTVLIRLGMIAEDELIDTLAQQLQIDRVDLESERIDADALEILNKAQAERFACLPMRRDDHALVVAMADPLDLKSINAIEALSGVPVEPLIAPESAIRSAIEKAYA